MKSIVALTTLIACCAANEIRMHNNCPFPVWPGILGNPGYEQPMNGGFKLDMNQWMSFNVQNNWQGRMWGRTNCDEQGHCETGDCGNKIECNGAGGVPPVTLAEITLKGAGGLDYYDVSLVDGYNLPLRMRPFQSFRKSSSGQYDCNPAGCNADLNAHCPPELATKNSAGDTVSCMSACMKFNTDEYCCRGDHNTPQTCKSSDWPQNYPAIFKNYCPDAYSYAYDDTTSTFTCTGDPNADYEITFCP